MILTFLIVSVLISGCAPKDESSGQMDYEETKKMVVDILKTDDGKKGTSGNNEDRRNEASSYNGSKGSN